MKKIVLFLILLVQVSWAQTPIVKFEFNGNLDSSNGANTLITNSGYSGTVSYTNDRFGQANSACVLPTNVTANLSTVLTNLPQGNSNRTVSVWVKNINYPNNALINVFQYGNNTVNQSTTILGLTRLFYYDIYTKATGIYTPMALRITTNETSIGSRIPAASICLVKILYVGQNLRCFNPKLYNDD